MDCGLASLAKNILLCQGCKRRDMRPMRKLLNAVRAKRDDWRSALCRWRYDVSKPEVGELRELRRVLFLRWDAKWGDSVIFSLVMPELRKLDERLSIEVIATPEMAPLFTDHFGVDRVHSIRKRPSTSEIRDLAAKIGHVDLLVHFSELAKPRDIFLMHCIEARHVASLDDSVGMVDVKLGKATQGLHMEDRYGELLRRCGVPDMRKQYIVPQQNDAEARVRSYLAERPRPFIAVNPFSKGRAKSFNVETTKRLIQHVLAMAPGHDVCLLTAPGFDREIETLAQHWDSQRCFLYPDTRSIFDNVALLANASAQITASTATVHIADGLGVPSFVLFPYGPGEVSAWHSVHPLSVNLMGLEGDIDDVNRLDWAEVETRLRAFLAKAAEPQQAESA